MVSRSRNRRHKTRRHVKKHGSRRRKHPRAISSRGPERKSPLVHFRAVTTATQTFTGQAAGYIAKTALEANYPLDPACTGAIVATACSGLSDWTAKYDKASVVYSKCTVKCLGGGAADTEYRWCLFCLDKDTTVTATTIDRLKEQGGFKTAMDGVFMYTPTAAEPTLTATFTPKKIFNSNDSGSNSANAWLTGAYGLPTDAARYYVWVERVNTTLDTAGATRCIITLDYYVRFYSRKIIA
nr:MAG: putative capsid protein [Arizlama virus]